MTQDDIQDGVMQYCAGMEIDNCEAMVAIAIDRTLEAVVGLLSEYGGTRDAVAILESEFDLA